MGLLGVDTCLSHRNNRSVRIRYWLRSVSFLNIIMRQTDIVSGNKNHAGASRIANGGAKNGSMFVLNVTPNEISCLG